MGENGKGQYRTETGLTSFQKGKTMHFPSQIHPPKAHQVFKRACEEVFAIHKRQAGRLRQALCILLKAGKRTDPSGVLKREYLSHDFIHRVRPQGKGEQQTERMPGRGKAEGEMSLPPPVPLGFALTSSTRFPAC